MKKIYYLLFLSGAGIFSAQQNCSNAVNVSLGTFTAPIVNGTAPTMLCGLTTSATAGLWYKYTATQNGNIKVSTAIAGQYVDTRLIVYKGTCSAMTCVGSNDDFSGNAAQLIFPVTAGTTYYFVFDNKWSGSGFNFTVSSVVLPADRLSFSLVPVGISGTFNNCIADMNGDYRDDIVSVLNTTSIMISHQQPAGGFVNTTYTIPSTVITPSWSIAAGDFDNNGFNDLIYGSGSGIAFVKANSTGTGYTSEKKPQSFLVQRTNFIDINNDGKLDAFVCDDNSPNRVYMNDGTNMNHSQGGLGDFPSGGNYGSIWMDYDNDGDQDLYIAKCSGGGSGPGGNIDELHRNNGNGTFTNVAATANMANPTQTWSSAWGDFNNDGFMDAVIGMNSSSNGLSKVMKNNGNATFSDVSSGSGYDSGGTTSREYVAYDFDNDGFLDILGGGNTIMFGDGAFHFTPNANSYPLDQYDRPIGDLNNDGFLDIQNGNNILMNNGNSNKWFKVTLQGTASNRNGIGARVEIYGAWGKQIRDVQSGIGFQNMNTLNTHFGIGQATAITKVVVKWPSGTVDVINNPTPNSTLFVLEGSFLDVKEPAMNKGMFSIYPNPAQDILNFTTKSDFKPTEAKIIDFSGKVVLVSKTDSNSLQIGHLSSGVYILHLKDKSGNSYSQKFIKK